MPKVSPIQNSFTAGEINPKLNGRTDIDRYKQALKACLNYLPTVQGPLERRPGTQFVFQPKHPYSSNIDFSNSMLIPFKYSRDESYVIEMGYTSNYDFTPRLVTTYFRFYKNESIITYPEKTITSVGLGTNFVTITTNADHSFSNNSRVVVYGLTGATQLNNREFVVTNCVNSTLTLCSVEATTGINGSGYDPWVSDGRIAQIYELAGLGAPVKSVDTVTFATGTYDPISSFSFAQSGDVIYFAQEHQTPFKLSRYGDRSWTIGYSFNFTPFTVYSDGPYLPTNNTDTAFSSDWSANKDPVNITASSVFGINENRGFLSTDLHRQLRVRLSSGAYGRAYISAVTDNTRVQAKPFFNSEPGLGTVVATADWALGVISGNPDTSVGLSSFSAVTFHEDRLWYFGGRNAQLIAGSAVGRYEQFYSDERPVRYLAQETTSTSSEVTDDNGITFLLNSSEANRGAWLASNEKGLLGGTEGGPWVIKANDQGLALTALNANARPASSFGAAKIPPVIADKAVIYVQNTKKKIRELIYFYDIDGFKCSELTTLSGHITGDGVEQIAFQKEPQPFLWARKIDGGLISLTYERDAENIKAGWARHVIGGYSDVSGTAAAVVALTVIPSSDGLTEELWMMVERYINGKRVRVIEYLTPIFTDQDDPEDAYFFDCGLTYDSTVAAMTVTGLNHLEGEVVSILKDGATHPDVTVSGGKIVLQEAGNVIHIGYSYKSQGQMLRLEAGSADGTAMGKTRRIHRVGMMLHRTGGLKIGMDFSTGLQEINFRKASDRIGEAVPLYTGIISETLEADYDYENEFCWEQSKGLPGTILAVMPQLVTQDR